MTNAPFSTTRPRRDPTILIVDDDEEIRVITAEVLRASSFKVWTSARADDAIQLMDRLRVDVVLTDALMPRMDGREFCRIVKSDARFERTKVVIMTSLYRSLRYRQEAYRQFRADDYILKPLDFPQLLGTLNRLTGRGATAWQAR